MDRSNPKSRILPVSLMLLLGILLVASVGCRRLDVREAEVLYEQGLYKASAEEYRDFIRENPKSSALPDAYLGLAWSEFQLGNYSEAAEAAELLRRRYPDHSLDPTATYLFALARFEENRYVEAVQELQTLVLHHPRAPIIPDARLLMARAQARLLRYEPAAESYRIYLEKYGDSPYAATALLGRVQALQKLARWDEAASVIEEYLKRFPEHPDRPQALMTLARLKMTSGDYERAERILDELRRVYSTWPGHRNSLEELARLYVSTADMDAAARLYKELYTLTPAEEIDARARYLLTLAEYHVQSGDTRQAEQYYRILAADFEAAPSEHALALYWLMKNELGRKRYEFAVENAIDFLEMYRTHALAEDVERELIDLLVRAGRMSDARERLASLVRLNYTNVLPTDFYRLASYDIELGNFEEAFEEATEGLERARRLDDNQLIVSGLNYLIIIQKMRGNPAAAIKHYWELKELAPTYLTATEAAYWEAVEDQFFLQNRIPPEFASRETFRDDWRMTVHIAKIDPIDADSTTASLATSLWRILTGSASADPNWDLVPEADVSLVERLVARDEFDELPVDLFPLRSTVGTDWIVHGRIGRDRNRTDGKTVELYLRLLRVDYGGIFPFEYWYNLTPEEARNNAAEIVRETVGRLKLYRPIR